MSVDPAAPPATREVAYRCKGDDNLARIAARIGVGAVLVRVVPSGGEVKRGSVLVFEVRR